MECTENVVTENKFIGRVIKQIYSEYECTECVVTKNKIIVSNKANLLRIWNVLKV